MRHRTSVVMGYGLVVAALAVGPMLSTGVAQAAGPSVHPHQMFRGTVNGSAWRPRLALACPEAEHPGTTGHPVRGQRIAVRSSSRSSAPGATGAKGHAIVVRVLTATGAATSTLTFTRYGSQPVPTSWLFPCAGTATLVFSAAPAGAGAHTETLSVTFVSPCKGTCAGRRLRR